MVKVGDKIRFQPAAWLNLGGGREWGGKILPDKVTGTVTEVYEEHRWFRVEYEVHGRLYYEGFKIIPAHNAVQPQKEHWVKQCLKI